MSQPLSRAMSTATAAYAVFCLVKPRHVGEAMNAEGADLAGYDLVARTYGVRDLPIGLLGMFGRSARTVRTAMLLRIAMDLGDATLLSQRAKSDEVRNKALAVTLGYGAANALALLVDRRWSDD